MAPAYRSIEDDQIVISDEPRPDLEALARWQEISDEDAGELLADAAARAEQAPEYVDEDLAALVAFIQDRGLTAVDVLAILTKSPDVIETIPGTENEPPVVIVGEPIEDGADVQPAVVIGVNGEPVPTGADGVPVLTDASGTPAPADPAPTDAPAPKAPRTRKKAGEA